MSRLVFPAKDSGEKKNYVFDFTSLLGPTDTISTASAVATVFTGTDASPQEIVFGSPSISGQEVTVTVRNGVNGVIYTLTCNVTVDDGQELSLAGFVAILDEPT